MTPDNGARGASGAAARMAPSARAHLRRFLRRARLRAGDLDALTYEALRGWASALADGEHGAARLLLADITERLEGRVHVPGESADGDDGLTPTERAERDRLEASTDGGDLLSLADIRDRVRLRDLRERARG